jgi:hypothetical protein
MKINFNELKARANRGDVDSMFTLGSMYIKGEGMPVNLKEAAMWFEKAAIKGKAEAQYNIGVMLMEGIGVKKDYRAAVNWVFKAAQQGSPDALNMIRSLFPKKANKAERL